MRRFFGAAERRSNSAKSVSGRKVHAASLPPFSTRIARLLRATRKFRRKIDVSGDGHANEGFKPERVRDFAVLSGVTVNGLAIINDEPYLEDYYRRHVIGGSGAFVMVAADYEDFVAAIRRKLLRELSPVETAGTGGQRVAAR